MKKLGRRPTGHAKVTRTLRLSREAAAWLDQNRIEVQKFVEDKMKDELIKDFGTFRLYRDNKGVYYCISVDNIGTPGHEDYRSVYHISETDAQKLIAQN